MFRFLLIFLMLSVPLPLVHAQSASWTGPDRSGALESLLAEVQAAESHGLHSADYFVDQLEAIDPEIPDPASDAFAEQVFRAFGEDLLNGRLDPLLLDEHWPFPPQAVDMDRLVEWALETGESDIILEMLAPRSPDYLMLRLELARWRHQDDRDWLPILHEGDPLEAGDNGPVVQAVRARLVRLGWLASDSPVVPLAETPASFEGLEAEPDFDRDMEDAIRRMQTSARLTPDGLIGPATLAWLNRTPSDRIDTLRVNLERLRWMPDDLGPVHIAVNVPDFTLQVVENGHIVQRHNVIVGRESRPSPVLTARMAYMIVNPWWETPPSLAVRDELPLFRRDPGAVDRLGFQILDRSGNEVDPSTINWSEVSARNFPYRLRQRPGPLNALGVVKFIFPNPHSTFLHDTPGRHRFAEMPRALSSGCVRVQDAPQLAEWVVRFAAADPDRPSVDTLIEAGNEVRINFSSEIRVHFLYFTAFSEGGSSVRFVRDLYQRDHTVIEALNAPRPNPEFRRPWPEPGHVVFRRDGDGYATECSG
ncbi:L,D-transpeptidase family protein [Hyphobacterium sp. HN65]|uniref:L,D-transpeptidase family protein n=1 Tax=Hyphobacterium lacteum TaxID=3116575 RepID=A0ABU7LNK0_9PROT|nr:L,D-transpeptidase family protein [Hyphobacterium sp. HN65]MEE2525498.1 L,D-transpeptidase family protein [Hyphobacterium sp. HN65]